MFEIWKSLKTFVREGVNVALDSVIREQIIDTPYGYGNFVAQIKNDRESKKDYILLKVSGGDATIYMRLEKKGALELNKIIDEVYVKDCEV